MKGFIGKPNRRRLVQKNMINWKKKKARSETIVRTQILASGDTAVTHVVLST